MRVAEIKVADFVVVAEEHKSAFNQQCEKTSYCVDDVSFDLGVHTLV